VRITLVLYKGLNSFETNTVIKLARAARDKGHAVTVFAMSTGVTNLGRDDFVSLRSAGVEITVCEHNRSQYQGHGEIEGVKLGSQFDLSGYVYDSDKVVSFL
jgi:sulfur relay (sulfurtransferase) complex TusBCD TusD component (DsrE family)